jgi:hypothetical protein
MIKQLVAFFRGQRLRNALWRPPKLPKDLMPEGSEEEALSKAGFLRFVLDKFPMEHVVAPSEIDVQLVKAPRRNVLLLSGGDPNAVSHGLTGGLSIRVPDAFEAAVSGHRVRVKVMARAARGIADAEFSIAYSTADVGNSGWQKMSVGKHFETQSFEWDVPTMVKGNGDYVGILPGQAGAIEVAGLVVCAVARI